MNILLFYMYPYFLIQNISFKNKCVCVQIFIAYSLLLGISNSTNQEDIDNIIVLVLTKWVVNNSIMFCVVWWWIEWKMLYAIIYILNVIYIKHNAPSIHCWKC